MSPKMIEALWSIPIKGNFIISRRARVHLFLTAWFRGYRYFELETSVNDQPETLIRGYAPEFFQLDVPPIIVEMWRRP